MSLKDIESYYKHSIENLENVKKFEKKMLKTYINKHITATLLDAGCGEGEFLKFLSEKYEKLNLIGIDISSHPLKSLYGRYNSIDVIRASITHLPFKESSFDYIISMGHVIGHCNKNERENSIKEFCRCLTSNGKLLFSIWSKMSKYLKHLKNVNLPDLIQVFDMKTKKHLLYLHFFKLSEIMKLLKKGNFEIEKLYFIKDDGTETKKDKEDIIEIVCVKSV